MSGVDPAADGAGQRPAWRPSMPRAEAERWAAGSAISEALYHVTHRQAAARIRREGFDLTRRTIGRAWGNGIYATPDRQVLATYAQVYGNAAEVIELRVQVHQPLRVQPVVSDRIDMLRQALLLLPGANARFIDLTIELSRSLPAPLVAPEAFSRVLREAGYDALEVVEIGVSATVGGSQVVVYDPLNVVVVDG